MIKFIEDNPILSLTLFVVIAFGFTIDSIPVTIMEARNFISAREMLTDDSWILTTMNGEPRYQKPPLPTWIAALFGYVFGINSLLSLRWPSLIVLAIVGITIYLLSKKLDLSKTHSLINGFIALTSFYVVAIIIEAPWDIYAHGFMLVALYQLFLLFQSQQITLLRGLMFIVFFGASILSKGPVSLYVLFLSFIIAYGISYRLKGKLMFWLKILALAVFGIVAGAWWYLYIRIADPETFVTITSRETTNWSSYNVRPFYYYWSFFVQSGIWTIFAFISLLYPYLRTRVVNLKAYKFSFAWTIIALILLSVIPEKKSRYLMPVLLPLAINIGFYINYLIRQFKSITHKFEKLVVYFGFGLIATLAIGAASIGLFLKPFDINVTLFIYLLGSALSIIIGILMVRHLIRKDIKSVFYLSILFIMCVSLFFLPLTKLSFEDHYNPTSIASYHNKHLYGLDNPSPEFIYHFGKKIKLLNTSEGIEIPTEHEFYLLTKKEKPEALELFTNYYEVKFIRSFDLNTSSKTAGNYRKRLVNHLYLLSRK